MVKLTFEVVIALTVCIIALCALSAVVFVVGIPFELKLSTAVGLAGYALFILFPGGGNLWIAMFATGGEDRIERVTAFVRGVAIITGWTSFILAVPGTHEHATELWWLIGICMVLFAWSIWREDRHQTQKLERKGLLIRD